MEDDLLLNFIGQSGGGTAYAHHGSSHGELEKNGRRWGVLQALQEQEILFRFLGLSVEKKKK